MKTFSLTEIASMLGVVQTTVYRWIERGMLEAEARQKGTRKKYLVHEKALEAFCIKYNIHQVNDIPVSHSDAADKAALAQALIKKEAGQDSTPPSL